MEEKAARGLSSLNRFWRKRRVFVTGHTGFKGSWLCLWLHSLGAVVSGYALAPSGGLNLFRLSGAEEQVHTVTGDIRDYSALEKALLEAEPEIVIHMAAQPLVRASYRDPVETYAVNLLGTVHLLEAVRSAVRRNISVRAVLNVTTDKVYAEQDGPWGYRETDALGGYDPYSSSKACSELAASAYRSSFFHPEQYGAHGVAVATARAGNVIGGGDGAEDRLIPDCMRALLSDQKALIRNPQAIRPWQHVLEPLYGYLLLARRLVEDGASYASAWNLGPREEHLRTVGWMVFRLGVLWGRPSFYELDPGPHPHEAATLLLDSAKSRYALGWQPVWNAEQALEKTVEWFQAYKGHAAGKQEAGVMRDICLRQIEAYTLDLDHLHKSRLEGGET